MHMVPAHTYVSKTRITIFAVAKLRGAPTKPRTIPRMELSTAVLAVKLARRLKKELEYPISYENFYSDSTVALGYIKNHKIFTVTTN